MVDPRWVLLRTAWSIRSGTTSCRSFSRLRKISKHAVTKMTTKNTTTCYRFDMASTGVLCLISVSICMRSCIVSGSGSVSDFRICVSSPNASRMTYWPMHRSSLSTSHDIRYENCRRCFPFVRSRSCLWSQHNLHMSCRQDLVIFAASECDNVG